MLLSGTCALIYQVAWLRELRLVFGGSTAASAAVVAIFMGGLGLGNALFGKWADRVRNPLRCYALLEVGIAAMTFISPWLIDLARGTYIGLGGQETLGAVGATVVRLLLSSLILGLPTLLMGGTLPFAVFAATTAADQNRRGAAMLYGMNTLGAVLGAFTTTFFLLQVLGTRQTLWTACLLNLVVVACAYWLAPRYVKTLPTTRIEAIQVPAKKARPSKRNTEPAIAVPSRRVVYLVAWIVGFAFMLMELVWYRMLGPILGGSTFTFGLILAVALLGIGIGGILYPLLYRHRQPTMRDLSLSCALEAAAIAIPFAIGDRLALSAAMLMRDSTQSFMEIVGAWSLIAAAVVLPAAIISGVQFPLMIALLGKGDDEVGKQVGWAFACNTLGSILGSLAGGFGLLPLLSATGAWRAVTGILALTSFGLVLGSRPLKGMQIRDLTPLGWALLAGVMLNSMGPTAVWRHSGIGAGRSMLPERLTPNSLHAWQNSKRETLTWETDGAEAGVAIEFDRNGLGFFVNGKCDGNAIGDAATQIMLGLLGSLLHPQPETCLVVGLGTGETAGWLAEVPSVRRVDVVELEPAVDEMARRCAAVNFDVLNHPKVRRIYNDAREVVLTSSSKYDLVVSEPSNPYRAGVANLFTREFYAAVANRLNDQGILVQWLQGYEIDKDTVQTVFSTMRAVFPYVEIWRADGEDMLLICSQSPLTYSSETLRKRIGAEPYKRALAVAWRAASLEGVLARFVAGPKLVEQQCKNVWGKENTDDRNRIEYGFCRTLGRTTDFTLDGLRDLAISIDADRPQFADPGVDWTAVDDERMMIHIMFAKAVPSAEGFSSDKIQRRLAMERFLAKDLRGTIAAWESQPREAIHPTETALLALAYAELGDPKALPLADQLQALQPTEALFIRGILLGRQGNADAAAATLAEGFARLRNDPWPLSEVTHRALEAAVRTAQGNPARVSRLLSALSDPFAVGYFDQQRRSNGCSLALQIGPSAALPWLESFEPHIPWNEFCLRTRVRVYGATGHPLAQSAKDDLELFLANEKATSKDSQINHKQ
jgi:spermidine synthase